MLTPAQKLVLVQKARQMGLRAAAQSGELSVEELEALITEADAAAFAYWQSKLQQLSIQPYRLYTIEEAATLLRISPSFLRKLTKEGEITSRRIGRRTLFWGEDIIAYVKRC